MGPTSAASADLAGEAAVVSGGASGIGAAMSEAIAAAIVVLCPEGTPFVVGAAVPVDGRAAAR